MSANDTQLVNQFLHLRATQHHPIKQNTKLLEGELSRACEAILLYGREDFIIPEARMLHRTMSAI